MNILNLSYFDQREKQVGEVEKIIKISLCETLV